MADKGKKRDTQTGQSESGWSKFTQQMKDFRAKNLGTYMQTEETAEEIAEKKRKSDIERMAKQGMR